MDTNREDQVRRWRKKAALADLAASRAKKTDSFGGPISAPFFLFLNEFLKKSSEPYDGVLRETSTRENFKRIKQANEAKLAKRHELLKEASRLWEAMSDTDKAPYLEKCAPDKNIVWKLDESASPLEWLERGKKLFLGGNFVMATMCFERAGDTMWVKMAKASTLRASADQMRGVDHEAFLAYTREAAEIFESVGKFAHAASCYYDMGDNERAERNMDRNRSYWDQRRRERKALADVAASRAKEDIALSLESLCVRDSSCSVVGLGETKD